MAGQWARISSLLVRKTPKQCKARWYEWLDPSIKKTEWSKEEDEKLLHLAKLMPTQWRTIAPIVGRTANQCLERYQKLLDDAEARDNDELGLTGVGAEAGPSADDIRRLRPGEIDPDPETKAARPDPIDMDEDEKEMLSEARARLANTQGKKAKRKARERQLEEARRLAFLQKRRELKAAGISMGGKLKVKGMDYMADIPFEKQPAAGFYDVSEESAKVYEAPVGQTLRQLEGNKRKKDAEDEERRKKQKQFRERKAGKDPAADAFLPERDAELQRLKEAEQIGKRRRLNLPAAQVGDRELEAIVKIGHAGETARGLVGENGATDGFIGDYTPLDHTKSARTPRTAQQPDNILAEARNLRNMTAQQTPLLGDENTPLHELHGRGTGFDGATPVSQVVATPNPLATPYRGATPMGADATGATPLRTPRRDQLAINAEAGQTIGDTPRAERERQRMEKRSLADKFASLPRPKNDFELIDPDEEAEAEAASEEAAAVARAEDAADRDARDRASRAEAERLRLARRSSAVKRDLPRPIDTFDPTQLFAQLSMEDGTDVEWLITAELVALLAHDAVAHPVAGSTTRGGLVPPALDPVSDADLAAARAAVHAEMALAADLPGASEAVLMRTLCADDSPAVPLPSSSSSLSAARCRDLHAKASAAMPPLAGRAAKAEKKLATILGGFQARSTALGKALTVHAENLASSRVQLDSFERLADGEEGAIVRRLESLGEEVAKLERNERQGQLRHQSLLREVEDARQRVDELAMDEAEMLNEQALTAAGM